LDPHPDKLKERRKQAAEIAREMRLEFDRSSDDKKQLLLKANGDLIQDNVIWAFARLNNAILLLASEED
jgi:hypothetical protein